MERNRFDLTEDERYCLNQIKRRTRYEDGKFYFKDGPRSNYEDKQLGQDDDTFDFASIVDRIVPFVLSRYFMLNNRMLMLNSELTTKLSQFLKYQPFCPMHMRPVNCSRKFPKRRVNTKYYPKCLSDLPKLLMMVDGLRMRKLKRKMKHSLCQICYGTKFGMPHATVTGVNLDGYPNNLAKIQLNHLIPGRKIDPKEYFAVIARMADMMGMTSEQRMTFEVPSLEQMQECMRGYDTASGYVPWAPGDKLIEIQDPDNVNYIREPSRAKKKDLATHIALYLLDNFKELNMLMEQGKFCTKPFFGESFNVEEFKWEILNCLEAEDIETFKKMKTKLRLFFIESGTYTMLSLILLRPIHKFLIGGPFGIGLEINSGAFKDLAREMLAQGHKDKGYDFHLPRKDAELLDHIYDLYPELIERVFIEFDISAFDQSLLYSILVAVALFYCMFYRYDKDNGLTRLLMSDMGYRLCVKYLHMLGMDRAWVVLGMMFSGKFETSTGNTIYQTFVFVSYIHNKMKKYANHSKIELLYIAFQYNLIVFKFQGDDLAGSYPKIFETLFEFTYNDYRLWCEKYGLIIKKGSSANPIIGKAYFYLYNGVWEEDDEKHVMSVTYLNNQICAIYENDQFIGIYPYRPASDLLFRLGNSDKASEYIEGIYAKVLSLAMLTMGNIECYQILKEMYSILKSKYKINYTKIPDFLDMLSKGSNTFYQLKKSEMEFDEFPTMDNLRYRHDQEVSPTRYALINFAQDTRTIIFENI
jgi:hypothetical protein